SGGRRRSVADEYGGEKRMLRLLLRIEVLAEDPTNVEDLLERRLQTQKHINFSLKSLFGGGHPDRVKRRKAKRVEAQLIIKTAVVIRLAHSVTSSDQI
ncbi:hypothetical protein PFISCL1PPCAC_28013, partial [Pristionchus fissidentatus]